MGTSLIKYFKNQNFQKKTFNKNWFPSPILFTEKRLERFDQFSTLKNDLENQNFEMLEEVVS